MYDNGCYLYEVHDILVFLRNYIYGGGRCFNCGMMANVLDCDLKINEFKLQSSNEGHFRTNILYKDMNPYYTFYYGLTIFTNPSARTGYDTMSIF